MIQNEICLHDVIRILFKLVTKPQTRSKSVLFTVVAWQVDSQYLTQLFPSPMTVYGVTFHSELLVAL